MYVNDGAETNEFHVKSTSFADLRSPAPCPGSRSSSADGMFAANQNMTHLKEEIVKDIKKELYDPLHEMLTKILNEVQTIKERTEPTKTCSSVSCQTEQPTESRGDGSVYLADSNKESIYNVPRPLNEQKKDLATNDNTNIYYDSRTHTHERSKLHDIQPTFASNNVYDVPKAIKKKPLVQPKNQPKLQTLHFAQGNALSDIFDNSSFQAKGKVVQVKPRQKSEELATRVPPANKRDCLANVLQFYIEHVVEGLAFHVDNLLDDLVLDECLTIEECISFKNIGDRKDRTRALLSLAKCLDLNVLERFMKHVKRYNEEVARTILREAESTMQKAMQRELCAICRIEKEVNIKDVADSLWSVKAIDDTLYGQIICPEPNSEENSILWKKVFNSLNSLNTKTFDSAKGKLMDCLCKHSVHLEREMEHVLDKNQAKLICICEQRFGCQNNETCQHLKAPETSNISDTTRQSNDGISNTTVFPVMHGGKGNIKAPVVCKTHSNDAATGHGRQDSASLTKPPVLPKRPSSMRRLPNLQSTVSAKSPDTFDSPLYDTPRSYATSSNSSHEQTTNSEDATTKKPQEFSTDEAIKDQLKKTSRATSGIPPLPVKKGKFPAWKKADEHGPSFV